MTTENAPIFPDAPASSWDVIVIGAGAAGLVAAARAAQRGCHTLLIEKNKKLGVKILMSGGTRCNITHHTDAQGIVRAFGRNGPFLHSALAALGPDQVVDLFERLGVPTKVEETGKIFPVSDRALDVRDALVRFARDSGCHIIAGEAVTDIHRSDEGFRIETSLRTLGATHVILTTGGKSYPGCGTTGDGYQWASLLGHHVVPPRPALTPITTSDSWMHELSGLTLPDVELSLYRNPSDKRPLDRRRGSFLFTHFGISGPVAMDISGTITAQPTWNETSLRANFLPSVSADSLRHNLQTLAASDGKRRVSAELANHLPKSLARAIAEHASVPAELPLAELSRSRLNSLIAAITDCRFSLTGTRGFEKAEVTAGGIALHEVDSRTMQSKLAPGLYLAGEILDLDGPIGGFNFQSAFSTGWLAGDSVGRG